jgi:hypothetical protein
LGGNSFGRNVILGIGAYKENVRNDIDNMIQFARTIDASGIAFLDTQISRITTSRNFDYKTYPARMAWLDGIYTETPQNLRTKETVQVDI